MSWGNYALKTPANQYSIYWNRDGKSIFHTCAFSPYSYLVLVRTQANQTTKCFLFCFLNGESVLLILVISKTRIFYTTICNSTLRPKPPRYFLCVDRGASSRLWLCSSTASSRELEVGSSHEVEAIQGGGGGGCLGDSQCQHSSQQQGHTYLWPGPPLLCPSSLLLLLLGQSHWGSPQTKMAAHPCRVWAGRGSLCLYL